MVWSSQYTVSEVTAAAMWRSSEENETCSDHARTRSIALLFGYDIASVLWQRQHKAILASVVILQIAIVTQNGPDITQNDSQTHCIVVTGHSCVIMEDIKDILLKLMFFKRCHFAKDKRLLPV